MERQVVESPNGHGIYFQITKRGTLAIIRQCGKVTYVCKEDIPKLRDWLNKLERHDEVSTERKRREDDEQGERVQ